MIALLTTTHHIFWSKKRSCLTLIVNVIWAGDEALNQLLNENSKKMLCHETCLSNVKFDQWSWLMLPVKISINVLMFHFERSMDCYFSLLKTLISITASENI